MPKQDKKSERVLGPASSGSPKSWTWPLIVRHALTKLRGKASLHQLYSVIERHPRVRQGTNANVRAKVRQCLEASQEYVRVDRGVWSFASKFSAKKLAKLRALRRKLYPRRLNADG